MQIIPNGTKAFFPTEHYEMLFYIGSLLFIHSKIFFCRNNALNHILIYPSAVVHGPKHWKQ